MTSQVVFGMSWIQVYGRSLNAYCVVQGLLLRKAGSTREDEGQGKKYSHWRKVLFSAKKTTGGGCCFFGAFCWVKKDIHNMTYYCGDIWIMIS